MGAVVTGVRLVSGSPAVRAAGAVMVATEAATAATTAMTRDATMIGATTVAVMTTTGMTTGGMTTDARRLPTTAAAGAIVARAAVPTHHAATMTEVSTGPAWFAVQRAVFQ